MEAESGRKILVSSGDKVSQNRQPSSRQEEGQAKSQARINHRKAIHGLSHRQEHRERDRMYRSRLAAVHTQGTNG